MGMRSLEKGALATDAEYKVILAMWLDLTQMLDQFYSFAPG
jgi:hypothetical protein